MPEHQDHQDHQDHQHRPEDSTPLTLEEKVDLLAAALDATRHELEVAQAQVRELSDDITRLLTNPDFEPQSWLEVEDAEQAKQMLEDLLPWLDTFFLRFPDGADVLRECWMHHPEVVEVLLALKAAHRDAMRGRGWGTQAMTWLWVYRTQTVEGIRNFMGACDLSRHETPAQPVKAVGASAIEHIAEQWVSTRSTPAPTAGEQAEARELRARILSCPPS